MIPIYLDPPVLISESPGAILVQLAIVLVIALAFDRMMFGSWGWR